MADIGLGPVFNEQFFEGVAVFILAIVIWKWDLWTKAKNFRTWSRHPEWGEFKVARLYVYTFASVAVTIAFAILMTVFTAFGPNPIILRVATGAVSGATAELARGAGHYLVWVAMFMVFLRHGWNDVFRGGYTMTAFAATHEFMWYFAYVYTNPQNWVKIEPFYIGFFTFSASFIFGFVLNFRKSTMSWRKLTLALAFMATFYVMWTMIGFPISIDNVTGSTGYYYSLPINLIEDLSWTTYAFMWL